MLFDLLFLDVEEVVVEVDVRVNYICDIYFNFLILDKQTLFRDVDTVQEFTDILVLDVAGLFNQSSCGRDKWCGLE